jgi:hypothetical protein
MAYCYPRNMRGQVTPSGRSGRSFGQPRARHARIAILLTACTVGAPALATAQDPTGSTSTAIAGGALGLASGAVLGTVGSIPPCWQTAAGVRCVRWGVGLGAAVGLASGAVIGAHDTDRIEQAATSAAIGFGAGAVVGLALVPIAQRFGWQDVLALGAVGGAIGAAPLGAALGFAGGTLIGAALTGTVRGFTLPDAVGLGLLGMSLGALTQWFVTAVESADAGASPGSNVVLPFTVRF